MPSLLQWISADRPKRYRIYVIYGEDAVLRADALDRALRVADPQERSTFHVGNPAEGFASAAEVWDAVTTQPLPGVERRTVVVHRADRLFYGGGADGRTRRLRPLTEFISGASVYTETTLIFILDRTTIGKRERDKKKSLPGSPVFTTTFEGWEQALKDYSSAAMISCAPLSIEPPDWSKPSAACRWLSLRLPLTQTQAAVLWRRVGGSSLLARDCVRAMRLLGIEDAKGLAQSEFLTFVDGIVGQHGAEDFVEDLLFGRKPEALASAADQQFDRSEWSKIIGLLGQRVDWLSALYGALATNEKLDQVMRRLQIPRHMILHYAHRDDVRHNIARHYSDKRVRHCRLLLAQFDAQLAASSRVPAGLGESLVALW